MSTLDDELLGEDVSDFDDFEITNEKEEALLQDDEEYLKSRDSYDNFKKTIMSDTRSDVDEQDILSLDVEEDFHDVDEKLDYEDEEEKTVEKTENLEPIFKTDSEFTEDGNQTERRAITPKVMNNVSRQNNVTINTGKKNIFFRNDRKRGNIRNNFQNRHKYFNNQQRRRNGTVLINPRFEGTVHVSDNNARLAWDNQHSSQSNVNVPQPWAAGNYETNNQAQLIKNILVSSTPLLTSPLPVQQIPQNFYQPPPALIPGTYERPLVFEPPPQLDDHRCNSQNDGSNHQMYPSAQSEPFMNNNRAVHLQYNRQLSNNNVQNDIQMYGSYSNYNSYNHPNEQNYSFDVNKSSFGNKNYNSKSKPPLYGTSYTMQNNVFKTDVACGSNSEFQNRYFNYGDPHLKSGNNYGSAYENGNCIRNNNNQGNENRFANHKTNYVPNQNNNFKYTNSQNHFNKTSQFNRNMKSFPQQNFNKDRIRRFPLNDCLENNLPEKRMKTDQIMKNNFERNEVVEKTQSSNSSVCEKERQQDQQQEEDEETRLYRLKIEEQKKERERLLRLKEERRKQMMLQKIQQDKEKLIVVEPAKQSEDISNQTSSTVFPKTTNNLDIYSVKNSNQNSVSSRPLRQNFKQNSNFLDNQKPNRHIHSSEFVQKHSSQPSQQSESVPQKHVQFSNLSGSTSATDLSNLTFKISNKNVQDNAAQSLKNEIKMEVASSTFMSNRVVVVKNENKQRSGVSNPDPIVKKVENESSEIEQGLSSFLNNRKVLKKDNALLDTRLVVVNNLSTTINQNKLVALTHGIGEIQKLQVDKQERQATILFKSVASAHAFFKKYQRRILDDLSVIEVKLEPMI